MVNIYLSRIILKIRYLIGIIFLIVPALGFTAQDPNVECKSGNPPAWPSDVQKQGIEGTVKAKIFIKDGAIQDIAILAGPEALHEPVKNAIRQYKCQDDGTGVE